MAAKITHQLSINLATSSYEELLDAVLAVPHDAKNKQIYTSSVARGYGPSEYEEIVLEISWE